MVKCDILCHSVPYLQTYKELAQYTVYKLFILAEIAECSPIIIQNSSNSSSQKNLDVRLYNRTTIQGATFNMRGQLYRGHANATALFSSPVVSALGSEFGFQSWPGQGVMPLRRAGKKMQAPLSGLAKSIYYGQSEHGFLLHFGLESSFL